MRKYRTTYPILCFDYTEKLNERLFDNQQNELEVRLGLTAAVDGAYTINVVVCAEKQTIEAASDGRVGIKVA